jgi:aryl-alcohol dehydrogenase-like predicted oxidoreductase
MAQPGIVAALASATSVDQLAELTAAMHLTLTQDQITRLDAASAEIEPASA